MFVSPSKMKLHRILRNRTIDFETPKKMFGNLVIIPTDNPDSIAKVAASRLFRPQQMMSVFTPRIIRPMDRKIVRVSQHDIYSDMKSASGGRIKFGKIEITSYGGRNLLYDIGTEYMETYKLASTMKGKFPLHTYMKSYLPRQVGQIVSSANYEKSYLVFVMDSYINDFRKKVYTPFSVESLDDPNPLIMFLQDMKEGSLSADAYGKLDKIIFYNPNAEVILAMDPPKAGEKQTDFGEDWLRLVRMNNFNNGTDQLEDPEVDQGDEIDPSDETENKKEIVKNLVIKDVAKDLKASKMDDFEAASKEEQDIDISIGDKVDKFVSDPKNKDKTFDDLVSEVKTDKEVKANVIKYVETKRIANAKLAQQSKNDDKELEVVTKMLDDDKVTVSDIADKADDDIIEPDKFDSPGVAPEIGSSTLSAIDDQYNKKKLKEDLIGSISSFSNSDYKPMALSNLEITDSSDDFKQIETAKIKYKLDDGKTLGVTLDIPKIVDKRFLYLNGNKKMIKKQLFSLPIVKTKEDRVIITTNYNKMTIERTNGKVSRRNAYLLKEISNYDKNPAFTIVYGSNASVNADYDVDFEFDELADTLSLLQSAKYSIIFNLKSFHEEFDIQDFKPIKKGYTPIGFVIGAGEEFKHYLAIGNKGEILSIDSEGAEERISDDLFSFIREKVLGEPAGSKLPQIGRSFVYTKVDIVGESYPIFAIVGMMNGITDILKRYKVRYRISEKRLLKDPNAVEVRFRDCWLYYEDRIENTLLLNVLYNMDTADWDFRSFDTEEPYVKFFTEKLDQPIYIKNTIRTNLGVAIDPITKSVLHDLKLPENIIDLLLLANTMLKDNRFRPQNDIRNYRVRGNEVVPAVLYSVIADAYVRYQNHSMLGKPKSLDISRSALLSRLNEVSDINDNSDLNPALEAESIAAISPKGWRGINEDHAYTLALRSYSDSMAGFLSANATPYSGEAGITRSLSYNPKITSVRGYIPSVDDGKLDATNILSPSELLSSFTSTMADPPRQAMQVG